MAAAMSRGSWSLVPTLTTFVCGVVFVVGGVTVSANPSSAENALELAALSLATTPQELIAERVAAGLDHSDCRDQCSVKTNETRMCACRNSTQECRDHGDCCADLFLEEVRRPRVACVPAFGRHVFAVVRCPDTWLPASDDDETKLRCEDTQRENLTISYFDDMPVLSRHSGLLYRNAYCASCNGDTRNLRPWEMVFDCKPENASEALKKGTTTGLQYDPSLKGVVFKYGDKNHLALCRIAIKEMLDADFAKKLNVTQCQLRPVVMTCPDNYTNADIWVKCHSYTSTVEDTAKQIAYRNLHCAMCNSVSVKNLRCHSTAHAGPGIDIRMGSSYAIVMDFSSWQGAALSGAPMKNVCGLDELHDPLLKRCVKSGCPADVCVKRGDCHWTRVTNDEVHVREDSSVVIDSISERLEPDRWRRDGPNAVMACVSTTADEAPALRPVDFEDVLSTILLLISVVCVILHIIAYTLLPKLRTGPSRLVLCLAVSVLVAQGTFLAGGILLRPGSAFCSACSVVSHGAHLAAFFWMNVMAMDVHRTFRKGISGSSRAVSAFLAYSAYAWLAPTVLVAAALTVEYLRPESPWSPSYGSPHCWINRPLSLIAFFGAPVLLLLLANTVFFLLTARSIHQTSKQTKLARRASAGPGNDQGRLTLYAKLAVVFGLTWVFGFAAALTGLRALWYPFIVLCGLQGAFIFLAFTFKRSVFRMVRERLCGRRGGRRRRPRSASTTLTTALHSTLSASSSALASVATGRAMPAQSTSSPKGVQKPLLRHT